MRASRLIAAVASVALATLLPVLSVGLRAQDGKSGGVGIESLPCAYNFSSGSGETLFRWCLTTDGNIGEIEAPAGYEHVFAEGYAVCWNDAGTKYWDYGAGDSGFGPPQVVSGCTSGSGCTIRRDTLDGNFRFTMKFAQNKSEREITIDQTLTNLYTDTFVDIDLVRQADLDMDGTGGGGGDKFGSSIFTVWLWESFARIGLTRRSKSDGASGWVGGTAINSHQCGHAPLTGTDYALGIAQTIGSLGAGKSKTYRFQYRVD
jgi:hypothetical protein